MTTDNVIIEINKAVVAYKENVALREVSIQIKSGEFLGIIGPNGAGKTTLLTAINGVGRLVSGRVKVMGQHLSHDNGHKLRKKVGYVAQIQDIDSRMPVNVREMAMIGRYGVIGLFRKIGSNDAKIVDEVLELVGMNHLSNRPVGHLSGGELQRVAIACCLAQEPLIMLLDEPTNSLDWKAQSDILKLVKLIHKVKGLTTLFVTHDLATLPLACDRVVLMKEGTIWADGKPVEVLTDENLRDAYQMPIEEVRRRRSEAVLI